ncbi:MAG: glycoside hydrolase family 38 C-terminal domain-containing protein [bacterium]
MKSRKHLSFLIGFMMTISILAFGAGAPAAAESALKELDLITLDTVIPVNSFADVNSKGYISKWLACGTFSTGVQGGMTGMVVSQKVSLSATDNLTSRGGEAGIEPEAGMTVDRGGGKTNTWRPYEATSNILDFGAIYSKSVEGVMYAAAYIKSDKQAALFLDMETLTGVSVWMNHELVWRSHGGIIGEAGKERVLLELKPGRNLLLLKFAGLRIERAAETMQRPVAEIRNYMRAVSAMIADTTGLAMSVKTSPLLMIGKSQIAVQAGLQPTGYFRGTAAKPAMECGLTVANGGDSRADSIKIIVESKKLNFKTERVVSLDPKANTTLLIPLPVSAKFAGGAADTKIFANIGKNKIAIDATVKIAAKIPAADESIFITPGFHADPVWIEDQRDYAVSLLGSARQNMYLTGADKNYGVYMSELDYLKPFYDAYPEFREPLKQQIKEGRVGTGGSYSQPVEKMISGEALIRNLLYGKMFHEKVLGDKPRVYMGWDIFGHVAQLSQIVAKTRNDGAMWSKSIVGFPAIFWHESLDGTKLLHKRMEYGSDTKNIDGLRESAYKSFEEYKNYGLHNDSRLDASDFKPPTPWYAGNTGMLRDLQPSIQVGGGGGNRFFAGALNDIKNGGGKDILTTTRDMSYYHTGTGLTRVDLKIGNRLAENSVQNAEKYAAIASLMGMPYPDKMLDKAWRQLLFGQHHDALTGTINDRSFLDLVDGYRESIELSDGVTKNSLDHIGRQINTASAAPAKDAIPVAIFNPLAWARTDVVRARIAPPEPLAGFRIADASGKDVPFEIESVTKNADGKITEAVAVFIATVPSLGYSTYYAVPAAALSESATRKEVSGASPKIETDRFSVSVDPAKGGGISSLYDLKNGKELMNKGNGVGNDIVRIKEDAGRHEPPWEIFTAGNNKYTSDGPATYRVENGPVTKRLIVRAKVGDTETERHIILYNGVPRVDFETFIEDYKGFNSIDNELFVVSFPVDLKNSVPVFEERFGSVVKKKSRQKFVFQTWQMNNYSDHGAATAHQWMDESWSVAVQFTDATGRQTSAYPVGMVAMVTDHNRAAVKAAESLQTALIKKGIHSTPWYDDFDAGRIAKLPKSDSTMPKELDKDLAYGTSFRMSFNIGKNNLYTEKVFKKIDPAAVARFEKSVAETGYGYLFVNDPDSPESWPPVPLLIVKGRDAAKLAEAVKKMSDGVSASGAIRLPEACNAAPKSEGPENYGVGMLNVGNILNSVENDDSMVMFLVHTASFFRRLPYDLVPENKTNAFSYSLYPHSGNWAAARTYRAGFEFNNPLAARQLTQHGGELPAKGMAFLTVEPANLVVTALKPAGNPTASCSTKPADAAQGLTVRLYEAEGKPAKGVVRLAGGIREAWSANMLEENQKSLPLTNGELRTPVTPFSIETYTLAPGWKAPVAKAKGMREAEPAQPVFARYWTHNAGAAPIGYLPVSVVIQGDIKTKIHIEQGGVTINEVLVTVTNDYTDRAVSGVARIRVPDDWRALPNTFKYDIKPGGHASKKIVICFLGSGRTGMIKAEIEHDGQTIEDVIEVGSAAPTFDVQREGNVVRVKVGNLNAQKINAVLSMIGPIETWGRDLAGGFGVALVSPRAAGISLDPGEERTYEFRITPEVDGVKPAFWLTAKLACNGRVYYKPVPEM